MLCSYVAGQLTSTAEVRYFSAMKALYIVPSRYKRPCRYCTGIEMPNGDRMEECPQCPPPLLKLSVVLVCGI